MGDIADFSSDISIHDEVTHNAVTTREIEGKVALDVNIVNPNINIELGSNLFYDEMTHDQLLNGTFQEVYSNYTAGFIYSLVMAFTNKDAYINVKVDGTTIINNLSVADINDNFVLNGALYQVPRFVYTINNGKAIVFEFPSAIIYDTSFIVEVKHGLTNQYLSRGLVVRAEK